MIELIIFIGLMNVAHYVGDFPLQTDEMARNKSKDRTVLLSHAAVYTMNLMLFALAAVLLGFVSSQYILFWVALNGVLHLVTDFFTAPLSSRMKDAGRTHDFFGVIGLDQLIHMTTLLITAYFLFTLGGPLFTRF